MKHIVRALRTEHWVKNVLVLAAFWFALGDPNQAARLAEFGYARAFLRALAATSLFCLVSSGIYIMNDIKDIELDRRHPVKKNRPVADGKIAINAAWAIVLLLTGISLLASVCLSHGLALVICGYIALQLLYSYGLKRVPLLDVFIIASGFVLRALAGAAVLGVDISPWLVLCTFLLALFLGFCKRKREKVIIETSAEENRPSLHGYGEKLLDQIIAILAASTVVSYAMYTMSPETVRKFGSHRLGFSIPFVLFGVFRYLDLVYGQKKGIRPERLLLTDIPIIINVVLYGVVILVLALVARA